MGPRVIDTVSALYVRADGPYPLLVRDCWTETRDARTYAGPNPVVAHPPCSTWGKFVEMRDLLLGQDGGCFEAALQSVCRFGGVLEHPASSRAWERYGIPRPAADGSWAELPWLRGWRPGEYRSWVAEVEQGGHGHRAPKRTWLLYVGWPVPDTCWPRDLAYHPPAQLSFVPVVTARKVVELMAKRERELTPEPFARLLVALAAGSNVRPPGAVATMITRSTCHRCGRFYTSRCPTCGARSARLIGRSTRPAWRVAR